MSQQAAEVVQPDETGVPTKQANRAVPAGGSAVSEDRQYAQTRGPAEVYTEDGNVRPGAFIQVFVPAWNSVLDYKVINQRNTDFEYLNLGELPVYNGNTPTQTNPKNGVVPADTTTDSWVMPWPDQRPTNQNIRNNAFYFDDPNTLIVVQMDVQPIFLNNFVEIPEGTPQLRYNDSAVNANPSNDDVFGYWNRVTEFVYPPTLARDTKFTSYNATNVDVNAAVTVTYQEYNVELVTDATTMKRIWLGKQAAARKTLPVFTQIVDTFKSVPNTYTNPQTDSSFTMQEFTNGVFHVPTFMQQGGAV